MKSVTEIQYKANNFQNAPRMFYSVRSECIFTLYIFNHARIENGAGDPEPLPGKSQVAICSYRNTCTVPLEKELDHSGPIAS